MPEVTVDECEKFLTGDVPTMLAEARARSIHFVLSLQDIRQLTVQLDLPKDRDDASRHGEHDGR